MRRVTEADLQAVETFLRDRIHEAMFPLSNLRRYGLDGDHPYAPQMWMTGETVPTGVLTVLQNGTVMPNCPTSEALPVLAGREVWRIIGPAALSRPLVGALGLTDALTELDHDEPHYLLDLADLVLPEGPGTLHPLEAGDRAEMIRWRVAYHVETLGLTPKEAEGAANSDYDSYLAAGSHRLLMAGDVPLCMTGFNAQLPDIVQIGGVYTPPDRRGQGHARRAVALHLAEARAEGVRRATLFASGPPAQRAYEAIGFRRVGAWTLFLMKTPVRIDG